MRPLRPLTLDPHFRPGPTTPRTQTRTNPNMVQSRICNLHTCCVRRAESAGGVRDRGSYTTPLGKRFGTGWSEIGRGLHLGDGRVLWALGIPNLWGLRSYMSRSEADEPVTAPYLACFLLPSLPTSARQPLILDVYRTLFIGPTRTQLPTPTPNQNTTPQIKRPKPTLKQRFPSLKALLPPHPLAPVHIVLARLPLPPPPSVCTWTRWYAAARSYAAWLGSALMSGQRESWVRARMREGEFGDSLVERCAWLNTVQLWRVLLPFPYSPLLFLSFFS